MAKPLVFIGSARSTGDTVKAVAMAFPNGEADVIDLLNFKIGRYSYTHANLTDDFLALAKKMLEADTIVFATPVYWYAMSGHLKDFFDRLTDLTEIAKDIGRGLTEKNVWLLVVGTEQVLPEGFEVPFRRTAEYFSMHYKGAEYLCTVASPDQQSRARLFEFGAKVIADAH